METHQVTVTTHGVTKTLECLEPWLDDGNIILVVEEKCFRVHRTILGSYSDVFKDMFAIPHSDDTEEDVIDGCPVVYLQDAAVDVQLVLKALYDRSFVFFYNTPMPISVLEAFIRMGQKYEMRQIFEEAKRRLSPDSPPLVLASKLSARRKTILFPRVSGNDPLNFAIINIAHEAGVLSTVVIGTFYCCLVSRPANIIDGFMFNGERVTLSAPLQRYYALAQHYLADVERQMIRSLAHIPPQCVGRITCPQAIFSLLHSFQDIRCPFSLWVPAWDNGLCTVCRAELRKRHEEMRSKLWKGLPAALELGPWEDLDKASGIPNDP